MGTFIPTTEYPDNRHAFCQVDETDEIVIGGTATHIFQISDFAFQTEGRSPDWFEVTYRQGIGGTIVVYGVPTNQQPDRESDYEVDYDADLHKTTLKIHISEEISKKFVAHRPTYAQLKLFLVDKDADDNILTDIVYGEKNIIRVIDPLDNGLPTQGE